MDFLYLLLLILLIAGTAGFLRLCARLELKNDRALRLRREDVADCARHSSRTRT